LIGVLFRTGSEECESVVQVRYFYFIFPAIIISNIQLNLRLGKAKRMEGDSVAAKHWFLKGNQYNNKFNFKINKIKFQQYMEVILFLFAIREKFISDPEP
jgi:hypothetical protein